MLMYGLFAVANLVCTLYLIIGYWSGCWCPWRVSSQPTSFHSGAGGAVVWVPYWYLLGAPVCRWPCGYHGLSGGVHLQAAGLEKLGWRVKVWESIWKRRSSWSPVWVSTYYKTRASFRVPSAAVVWAWTLLSAANASYGSIRSVVV